MFNIGCRHDKAQLLLVLRRLVGYSCVHTLYKPHISALIRQLNLLDT